MYTRFKNLSYSVVVKLLNTYAKVSESATLFLSGDHWQSGSGWIGPDLPRELDSKTGTARAAVIRSFTSNNVIAEVVTRHRNGVVGKEPVWSFTVRRPLQKDELPTEQENSQINEVHAALTTWWNNRRAHQLIQHFTDNLLVYQRAVLRIYIPESALNIGEDGEATISVSTLDEALDKIYVEVTDPVNSLVFTDPKTEQQLGIVQYVELDDNFNPYATKTLEITYLDENGRTIVERLQNTVETGNAQSVAYELGGYISMAQGVRLTPFVTPQLEQLQRVLNLGLSMLPRNMETSGFLERIITNSQLAGTWEKDENGNETGKFIPDPYITGAGRTNFLTGIKVEDAATGSEDIKQPGVFFREPVDTQSTINAINATYGQMLREVNQAHVIANTEAGDSGYSREQQRADFGASLEETAPVVQAATQWMLEAVTAFAEMFIGKPGLYTGTLRADVTCRISTGPLSVAERAQNVIEVNEGLLSEETAMERNGVLDTDAEKQRIASEPSSAISLLERQATALANLVTGAQVPLDIAAKYVALPEEFRDEIVEYASVNDTSLEEDNLPPLDLPE